MEFTYDNSTANIRNPFNPPQRITRGEQTSNEMAITFLNVVTVGFGIGAAPADAGRLRQLLERLRDSGDRPQKPGN